MDIGSYVTSRSSRLVINTGHQSCSSTRHSSYIPGTAESCRGRGGIATYRGMSAHPIIGGSPLYLALKLCRKVAHNPNIDLLILTFACTYINKKLCLKMCLFTKIAIMCVAHLHSGIVYYKLCRERSYAFSN